MGSNLWQKWKSLWNVVPKVQAAPSSPAYQPGYPQSFVQLPPDERLERAQIFEPALQHYPRGFRLGEPTFRDPEVGRRWFAARRRVLDHLAQLIGASTWKDALILRGSYLLKQWIAAAREPGDLDWVIKPSQSTWRGLPDWAIFNGLTDLVRRQNEIPQAGIRIQEVVVDEIWNYDRVPGRRMMLTWQADDLPLGTAQMDFAMGENLWGEPVETNIALPEGRSTVLWAATPELSLAWKLLWLGSDMYPQGKDLYDATLLAEYRPFPVDLLRQTMTAIHPDYNRWAIVENELSTDDFQWDEFQKDYPEIQGTAQEWLLRLITALKPTVDALESF